MSYCKTLFKTKFKMTNIIKASGERERFDKKKIKRTVLKAGASKQFAESIANKVGKKVYEGIATKEILRITLKLLEEKPDVAARYDLKRAIMSLGPSGFPFEKFFAAILKNYGYKTEIGTIVKGKSTTHEVDIIARKNKSYMIECKYHNKVGIHTNSKVMMYTYARFLDLKNNPKNKIDKGWLATNTKCSPHAIQYSKGVGLKITSWQYASGNDKNLQELIELKKLYPITILKSVKGHIKDKLSQSKIILAKELLNYKINDLKIKTRIDENSLKQIIREAHKMCSC